MKLEVYRTMMSGMKNDSNTELVFGTSITLYGDYKIQVNHLLDNKVKDLQTYLSVGNSDSAEASAASGRASASRMFGGYEVNGCVCGGVNTGADCSDL